eukprot:TRINITY_DN7619_c0_g1_i11.p1 TRINITY_DN7619_c0_g1~~TRINITY_DN7619_c0_g1_i11.p1  ORF type:complete len:595 (-),score=135.42 TRINITY_DN7619_c0_g1_i11:3475-5187(-)
MGDVRVMFDCGLHPSANSPDEIFPNFASLVDKSTSKLQLHCVVITHLHVDHIGALPVLVHHFGYTGPIVSSLPSKTLAPIMLNEASRFIKGHPFEKCFSEDNVRAACARISTLPLHQQFSISPMVTLTTYYAGHVLGATMALIESHDGKSVMYTGDFNMTADRHLGAAKPPRVYPDVLISESTYADFVRDSKKKNERLFLQEIQDCIGNGGKVLISSSAVGRAQELCVLLESCWEKLPPECSRVPLYFNKGTAWQATLLYKLFVGWANADIKSSYLERNIYDFPHVQEVDVLKVINSPGPMVIFASPGMIMGGASLSIFHQLAPDARNLVVLPGHPLPGTVGYSILQAKEPKIRVNGVQVDVKCKVSRISFSAHTDSTGILQMIEYTKPSNVVLVHGTMHKMMSLKETIQDRFSVPCYCPANGDVLSFPTKNYVQCLLSSDVVSELKQRNCDEVRFKSVVIKKHDEDLPMLVSVKELSKHSKLPFQTCAFRFKMNLPEQAEKQVIWSVLQEEFREKCQLQSHDDCVTIDRQIKIHFKQAPRPHTVISWPLEAEELATEVRVVLSCRFATS